MGLRAMVFASESGLAELLRIFLECHDHEVQLFSGVSHCQLYQNLADEQCRCLKERPCADLLLVDGDLTDIDALDFLRQLQRRGCKALAANKAVISSDRSPAFASAVAELGCHRIGKPFRLAEVRMWVDAAARRVATGPPACMGTT